MKKRIPVLRQWQRCQLIKRTFYGMFIDSEQSFISLERHQADLATGRERQLTTGERGKDLTRLPVLNLPLCHWSIQLLDLCAPSSTNVPVLLLNQSNQSELNKQVRMKSATRAKKRVQYLVSPLGKQSPTSSLQKEQFSSSNQSL